MRSISRASLVEIDSCVFLAREVDRSFGHEDLDAIGREAFVNHVHLEGVDHKLHAEALVGSVIAALKQGWPGRRFRVYLQSAGSESTVRFHMVRESEPNWYESGLDDIEITEIET